MIRLADLKQVTEAWQSLGVRASQAQELLALALEEGDASLEDTLLAEADSISKELGSREFRLILSDEHDERDAILAIHAGAGGTESQDWAQMLLRMYLRWAEREGYSGSIMDVSHGDEAGIKSAYVNVSGRYAYGYLKADRGVHRLVRLSPFDSAHMRHTSFALVEALPEAEDRVDVDISPDDLRVDVFPRQRPRRPGRAEERYRRSHNPPAHGHSGKLPERTLPVPEPRVRHEGAAGAPHGAGDEAEGGGAGAAEGRARFRRVGQPDTELRAAPVPHGEGSPQRGYETSDTASVLDGDLNPLLEAYLLSRVGRDG